MVITILVGNILISNYYDLYENIIVKKNLDKGKKLSCTVLHYVTLYLFL